MTQRIINKGYLVSLLLGSMMFYVGACSDDPAPGGDVSARLKSKPWKISSVTVDGIDKTSLFAGMTLTFTASDYEVSPPNEIWPASGTWQFTDSSGKVIKRNDGLEITVSEITVSSLKLTLQWNRDTFGPGRAASVSGEHIFAFE